jgi:hypothetical protein
MMRTKPDRKTKLTGSKSPPSARPRGTVTVAFTANVRSVSKNLFGFFWIDAMPGEKMFLNRFIPIKPDHRPIRHAASLSLVE